MIRLPLCLLLILVSTLATIPLGPQSTSESTRTVPQGPTQSFPDPSGTNDAFNVTFAHFDLYTRVNTTDPIATPPGNLTWSSNFTNSTGSPIPDTAFRYQLPANTTMVQELNYTLNIPQGVASNTFITFKWNGTLGIGANATYQIFNGTDLIFPAASVTRNMTFTGGPPLNVTGGHPFSCAATEECILVPSEFLGSILTLRFVFGSNSTGSVDVRVENVVVASVQTTFTPATSHKMILNPSDEVEHTGNFTLTYNAAVTYPKPNTSPVQNITHTWRQMVATFFVPSSYTDVNISQDGTLIYPGPTPVGAGTCTVALCTNSTFISLNMTRNIVSNSIALVTARSANAIPDPSLVQPLLGNVATDFWMPRDSVNVRLRIQPGVNVSGSHTLVFTDQDNVTRASLPSTSNKGGTYLYSVVLPETAPLGNWNIIAVFLNGYDYGRQIHQIHVDEIRTTPLTLSGTAGQGGTLTVRGTLTRGSGSAPAAGVNATVFVVDMGSLPGPVFSIGDPQAVLHVSNITFANGVFTGGESLIVLFTVANPAPSTAFYANFTIEHEWYAGGGGDHGATAVFPLNKTQAFLGPASIYRLDVTLTTSGVQVTVVSPTGNSVTRMLSSGLSEVSSTRQHFGNFKISVTSVPAAGGSQTTSLPSRSPTYGYVFSAPLLPSRLLAFSDTVSTAVNGTFSAAIPSEKTLGALRLAAFVLARDQDGIVLGKDQTERVEDSTILTPEAKISSEVTLGQSVTVSISLKSNSSRLTVMLIVNLGLSGSGIVDSRTLTIGPGKTETATFTFTAPAEAGSYLLTFSSPQYGPPLISPKTLQVSLLPGSLQALIPAIIGLVAALVILGLYLIRKRPETEVEKEEKKRPTPGKPSKPAQGQSPRNP